MPPSDYFPVNFLLLTDFVEKETLIFEVNKNIVGFKKSIPYPVRYYYRKLFHWLGKMKAL